MYYLFLHCNTTKTTSRFRLTIVFSLLFLVLINARTDAQTITLDVKDAPLEQIFEEIKKQGKVSFFFSDDMLAMSRPVTIKVRDEQVQTVLDYCFKNQPFSFKFNNNSVTVIKTPSLQTTSDAKGDSPPFEIRGKVINENGEALPGATIAVKGTKTAVPADNKGEFTLTDIPETGTLLVSSIGFIPQEIRFKAHQSIIVRLKVEINNLNETVVVAYNSVSNRSNVGSVATVKGKQIQTQPNRSLDRSLQGLAPGLLVTSGNGQPGGGVSNFLIRGIGTGTNADNGSTVRNPLIILDGIPVNQDYLERAVIGSGTTPVSNPLAQLNTNDIESISILKDASAIALYGSRASNGVIIITTKKGNSGKSRLEFQHQTDISSRIKERIDVLSQQEYLDMIKESYRNRFAGISDADILTELRSNFPVIVNSPGDTSFYQAPEWFKELYRPNAVTVSNNLSATGGTEKTNYYFNFGYHTQNGIVKNTGYDQGSVRVNIDHRPKSWLRLGVNSLFSYNKQQYTSALVSNAYLLSPLNPVRLTNGDYYYAIKAGTPMNAVNVANPAAAVDYNLNQIVSFRNNASVFGEITHRHLSFRTFIGLDLINSNVKDKVDPRLPGTVLDNVVAGVGSVSELDNRRTLLITNNILRYERNFNNKHQINALVGHESQESIYKLVSASSRTLAVPYFEQVDNGSTNRFGSGSETHESLQSFFAQINYGFRNKLLFSGSARRDGSSKFGSEERYGNYWSVGGGWVVSEEKFLKSSNLLSFLKIRGSLGTSGNSAAINSATRFFRLFVSNYSGNPAVQPLGTPGNENVKWEETLNADLGLDANLFANRVHFTADYYKRKTKNLLFQVTPSLTSGFSFPVFENVGEITNTGVELSLSVDVIRKRDFRWNINMNWSKNKNELVKAYPNFPKDLIGKNWASFYYVRWAGVNPADGTPQWLDSTGKVTSVYDQRNVAEVGKSQPDGFGGLTSSFRYKNWELSAFFYYQYGYEIYDNLLATLVNDGAISPLLNQSRSALDRWVKPGDNAQNPRRIFGNTDGGSQPSSRYIFEGDYIRLRNVMLSYELPGTIVTKWHLQHLRVFVQAYNVAVWTKYKGSDPENIGVTGVAAGPYPQARSFSAGLTIGF